MYKKGPDDEEFRPERQAITSVLRSSPNYNQVISYPTYQHDSIIPIHPPTNHVRSLNARLPLGSIIFVTGVTGYIGSWIAHEALSLGYNVRGAVVFTSTSLAAAAWGATGRLEKTQHNESFRAAAWDSAFQHPSRTFIVYAAAKAASEKAAWSFMHEVKPHFTFNVVLPNCNFGPSLMFEKQRWPSTGGFPKALFDGDVGMIASVPPLYFIDVRDDVGLHVAALRFTWNTVLAVYRRLWPDRAFPEDFPGLEAEQSEAPTESALMALKEVFGQEGWVSLEEWLRDAGFDRRLEGEFQKMDIFK